ncbi:M48 family metallopeptidase [Heliorestis convoluta]|uniref:M48 family metallopeptidase n=1 Tax=Heliorestis convoluta TaxID=356322 RepID=UPI001389B117|nr:SprT family zinc-dependent metalloprotease [Heliorestis convoluta]
MIIIKTNRKKRNPTRTYETVSSNHYEMTVAGEAMHVTIERRKGIVNSSLRLSTKGLLVRVPLDLTEKEVQDLFKNYKDWIQSKWQDLLEKKKRQKNNKGMIYYRGKPYQIKVLIEDTIEDKKERIHIDEEAQQLHLQLQSTEKSQWREILKEELRKKGKEAILQRIPELNKGYDYDYNKVTIKDQKTRWGSCSGRKNLNFSWRLILMPPTVMDYVIVHELCHLGEMNHSPMFWYRVSVMMPQYERYRQILREEGTYMARIIDEVELLE